MEFEEVVRSPGRWFVLHTRSRQEKSLAADLRSMRVPHYLPLSRAIRSYGRQKQRVEAPLFPGYVFLRGDKDAAYEADRTRRVARILPVPDQAALSQELHSLDRVLATEGGLRPHPWLERGIAVEVRCGPFKGVCGIVESWRSPHRLVLRVRTLGQASSLEIDGSLLEPASDAA